MGRVWKARIIFCALSVVRPADLYWVSQLDSLNSRVFKNRVIFTPVAVRAGILSLLYISNALCTRLFTIENQCVGRCEVINPIAVWRCPASSCKP